jgi:phosphinothricin acetyltransferase
LEDAAAITAIYNHYVLHSTATYQEEPETVEHRQRWIQNHTDAHPMYVAEVDGGVIGWASLSKFHPRSAYRFTVENSVYLHPAWTGRGLGSQLMETLITAARQCGHRTIIALISDDQTASLALHLKFGFQRAGLLQRVGRKFDRWLDLSMLQLML